MLRVCIEGVDSAAGCRKIAEATLTQANKDISDKLVVGGKEQPAFKDSIEVEVHHKKQICMVHTMLAKKYFFGSSLIKKIGSLQVVLSGRVVLSGSKDTPPAPTTSMPANSTANATTARLSGSDLTKPFELTAMLTPRDYPVDANSIRSIEAYQCTSAYQRLKKPAPISSEDRMLTMCIKGSSSDFECENFAVLLASRSQCTNDIADVLVARGKPECKYNVEMERKDGICKVQALLKEGYFQKKAENESLQLLISGTVAMASLGKSTTSGGLRTEPPRDSKGAAKKDGEKVPFEFTVPLTVPLKGGDDIGDETGPKIEAAEEDGAARLCSVATGILAAVIAVAI